MTINIETINDPGQFSGVHHYYNNPIKFTANFPLWLIRNAWDKGCNFEDLADGYGPGNGTHGDWSGIRDSSEQAVIAMLNRAIPYLDLE